jgi:hypothetical protein
MTTDTASTELQVPGAPPPAPMSPADAWSERARLLADPEWKAAFEKGDPAKRVEMNRVMSSGTFWSLGETVNPNDFPPKIAEQIQAQRVEQSKALRETQVDDLRLRAAIPPEVEQMVREGQPVTAEEKRRANEERDRLFADSEWTKKLRAGDSDAKSRLALLQIIRSAPLRAA